MWSLLNANATFTGNRGKEQAEYHTGYLNIRLDSTLTGSIHFFDEILRISWIVHLVGDSTENVNIPVDIIVTEGPLVRI